MPLIFKRGATKGVFDIFFKRKKSKDSDNNNGQEGQDKDLFKVRKEFLDDEKTAIEEHRKPEQPKVHEEDEIPDLDFDFDFGDDEDDESLSHHTPGHSAMSQGIDYARRSESPQVAKTSEHAQTDPYFAKLYKEVTDNLSKGKMNIDAKQVLSALNKYYNSNKADEVSAQYSVQLEDQIQQSLDELTQHEDEWKDLQDLSHKVQGQIAEKEREIEKAVENFKKLVRKLAYTKKLEEDHHFKLQDGSVISNIAGLMAALPHMSDSVFSHHVNEEKNDFADWIKHTFDDSDLADSVRECKSRKELYLKLKEAVE